MSWIKRNKKKFYILIVVVFFGAPILINVMLSFDMIPSVGTGNGDWLGFWGSFLGSIIGGVATLLGVLLTLDKMDEERKAREDKEVPIIMPVKSEYEIHENDFSKGKYKSKYSISNYIKQKDKDYYSRIDQESDEIYEYINLLGPDIKLVNISGKNALEVVMFWEKPSLENINKAFGIELLTTDLYDEIQSTSKESAKKYKKQLILANQVKETTNIYLYREIERYIYLIVDMLNKYYEENDSNNRQYINVLPMGRLKIKYKDIFADTHENEFNIIGQFNGFAIAERWYLLEFDYEII